MGRSVLVVDDDDDIREITQLALELGGTWSVLAADRGTTALTLAREHRPDVILLDVMMPVMDGPTTFHRLQEDPLTASIPVILLTAKAQDADVQEGFLAGADDYIRKPFSPRELSARVQAVLGRR